MSPFFAASCKGSPAAYPIDENIIAKKYNIIRLECLPKLNITHLLVIELEARLSIFIDFYRLDTFEPAFFLLTAWPTCASGLNPLHGLPRPPCPAAASTGANISSLKKSGVIQIRPAQTAMNFRKGIKIGRHEAKNIVEKNSGDSIGSAP
jgi:hypothetical protein